jgi:FlaA1/EpsC-like NDP-sugar epimerase
VTVTDPRIERYFMTIPEAARLVIQAGAIGRSGEILLLEMGDPVRIADLAADMIRLSGLEVGRDIEIQFTGLRPGEKRYEELHLAGERPLETCHPKIRVLDHKRRDAQTVLRLIDRLIVAADTTSLTVRGLLGQLVPEFGRNQRVGDAARRAA